MIFYLQILSGNSINNTNSISISYFHKLERVISLENMRLFSRLKVSLEFFDPFYIQARVSVQGVKSLGGYFACLFRKFDFYEVKKKYFYFSKEKGNTFTLLIISIVKILQKEQSSTNLLLSIPNLSE